MKPTELNPPNIGVKDFPKIECPFKRVYKGKRYIVTDEINPGYEWVFEDGVRAVDKLNGTSICVLFKDGIFVAADNRTNRIVYNASLNAYMPKEAFRITAALLNGINRGLVPLATDARIYGELIAPKLNGNLHNVESPLFVPFSYLYERCHWNSWINNKYPKSFEAISEWFKELPSLFTEKVLKKQGMAEGLVFTDEKGRMAKLRRDMFEWYYE